jgi:hypothetical protein
MKVERTFNNPRICKVCGIAKDLSEFRPRSNKRPNTKRWVCKTCSSILQKIWSIKNHEHCLEYRKNRRDRIRSTIEGRLVHNVGCLMRNGIEKKSKRNVRWSKLTGYTIKQLIEHIEKQFCSEMSWDNYGSYWQIDHKIPISAFNFNTPDDIDFKKCWALGNLQPMVSNDNLLKRNKLDKPFQPSLCLKMEVS